MNDIFDDFIFPRRPTPDRPLLGQTVLVVEDSRFAGEMMRLMCLRGGARIRRADCLRAAARHLKTYRPTVVVVDLGLPDGSGADLIRQLSRSPHRVPVLLALSGDSSLQAAAIEAGADDFLAKPFGSVSSFHNAILSRLPLDERPRGPREITDDVVQADSEALFDDLALISDLLDGKMDAGTLNYAVNFAIGLGRSVGDDTLVGSARRLQASIASDRPSAPDLSKLVDLVRSRLTNGAVAV